MLPFIQLPDWHIGPVPIHGFGLLVAIGVLLGTYLARRRAEQKGIAPDLFDSFLGWTLIGGFIGAHVLDTLFYHPEEIASRPWSLLFVWEGLSSFGGFIGSIAGGALWKRRHPEAPSLLALADSYFAVFPIAWTFGRAGCAVVHDHPGIAATSRSLLAVAFPGGPRYDLGLLEMLFSLVLAIAFAATWRRKLPLGFYVAAISLCYAPGRFGLDFLRIRTGEGSDPRYLGLTPAQWACIALAAFGVWLAARIAGRPATAAEPPGER